MAMFKIGAKNSCGKIIKIWDKPSHIVMPVAVSSASITFNLMNAGTFIVLKCRNEAESELKNTIEYIEYIKASPSSMKSGFHLNLNLNIIDFPFNLFKLEFNKSPKSITDLIDTKHKLERYIALCSFYLYTIKNLNESLERFNDEEKIRIIGALLQFRDDISPYTRVIDNCPFFKQDVVQWGFIGKEAEFDSHDDRVCRFRDDIGKKFRLVKIDDKHTFYFEDFDLYLSYYINRFKKIYQQLSNAL